MYGNDLLEELTDQNDLKAIMITKSNKPANDIYFTKPDYIVFSPKGMIDERGDTYNDHFHVFNKSNSILYAAWTQASFEGSIDQHIVFSKSIDAGVTWSEPIVLAGSECWRDPKPIASWQQPMINKNGRIYVLYNQQIEGRYGILPQHCGLLFGIYSDDDGICWSVPENIPMPRRLNDDPDPEMPPDWSNWMRPLRLGEDGKYLVAMTRFSMVNGHKRHAIEFMQFDNIDEDPAIKDIHISWFSCNEKALKIDSKLGDICEEASIVKLPDDRLFALMRTAAGHPYWSISEDHGKSWSDVSPLLDKDNGIPYLHPTSPCPLFDWKGSEAGSGYYFALIHNTFDFNANTPYQNRGPLYLIAGKYQADARQPIWFSEPKLFIDRKERNALYPSITITNQRCVLWYNDQKYHLLGKIIDDRWFDS